MQLLFDVLERMVKLKLALGLRFLCEENCEKAASCGTIHRWWPICLDVGARRSQRGSITQG